MDAGLWQRIGAIFDAAVEVGEAGRSALLDRLCAGDADVRREVEALLAADAAAAGFDHGVDAARRTAATGWFDADEQEGMRSDARIGPWRILHEIGRGGMGVVWLAERADGQFEQRAALKLIKRGMDSEAVVARFLRERQILARLEHPHIARLLDGGISADGRPYFAMEYVDGEPLLRHCAEKKLGLEQRIRIFVDICAAVQFAHGQLVIHRDIKPSNILVAANGEAKLLDFGIAKLLDDSSGGATATIDVLQRPLTRAYAAPEQLRGEPVTTATDIYALGGVLYELLTGRRALALGDSATLEEVIRAQDTTDPAAPSKAAGDAAPIPAKRLRGDLDTIVLKTLRREPQRRYATVAALADDLQRYLSGQPIGARRDHTGYRVGKFVGRHRAAVAAVAVGVALLVAALAIALWQAREKTREAEVSREVTQFLVGLFNGADPSLSRGATLRAQDLLEQGTQRLRADARMEPSVRARLLYTVATTYVALGLYDRALPLAREALELRRGLAAGSADVAESAGQLGRVLRLKADYAQAEPLLREALAIRRKVLPHDDPALIESLDDLAKLRQNRGEFRAANDLFHEALDAAQRYYGSDTIGTARYLDDYAANLDDFGRRTEAVAAYRKALAIRQKDLGAEDADVATSMLNLGTLLDDSRNYAEAVVLLERALAIRRKVFGPDHPLVGFAELALAGDYDSQERLDDAERQAGAALAIFRRSLPDDHPKIGEALNMLAIIHLERRDFAAAIPLFREAVERFTGKQGADHPDTLAAKNNLSYALARVGQLQEAERLQRDVLAHARDDNGQGALAMDSENLAGTLEQEGKFDEAVMHARRALELERRHEANSSRVAVALRLLAVAEEMDGDAASAERDFRAALRMQAQLAAGEGGTTYEWKIPLADLLVGTHRCAEALPLLDDAIGELKAKRGATDACWQPEAALLRGYCRGGAEGAAAQQAARAALGSLAGVQADLYPTAQQLLHGR
ncbi:MAG TPA: tetratricopeptide repeat protein [Rudaea sp.]|nr:tetratricopeptide repeat protein [Rudaea sp.]